MFMVDFFYNDTRRYILKHSFLNSGRMTEAASLVPEISV